MTVRDDFVERFALLKETYQLTYPELNKILGINGKSTINEWIRAKKSFPNETVLVIISNIFAVSIDWLLGRIDRPYNETILTKLEEEHAVAIFEMAVAAFSTPLPKKYENTELRRQYYTQGQRANLIYAAMSSFYKTVFSMGTLKQLEKDEIKMKSLKEFKEEQMKDSAFAAAYADVKSETNVIRAIVDTKIAHIEPIRSLLYGKLDAPIFDLEAAIEQHKNK